MARGEEIDWTASPQSVSDPIPLWTERTGELLAVIDAGSPLPLGMVAAELSVHAWDLATALGHGTDDLDQALAEEGMSVVFISAELEEVVRLSHRIAVMRDREKVAEIANGDDVTVPDVVALIAGSDTPAAAGAPARSGSTEVLA